LQVGDLIYVRYGDSIPVDGVVVRASDFEVNEASLTGGKFTGAICR
jgi:magnesium-transporting ATPase (P-type)